MKYRTISLVVALAGLFSATAHATDVNLGGTVIASACTVDTDSISRDVDLGRVQKKDLQTAGSAGDWQPFKVNLVSCPAATRSATVIFTGTPYTGDATLYANAGTALGVVVQMAQDANKTLVQGNGTSMTVNVDAQHNATYVLAARVISTGNAVAGTVNSIVQMSFTYQ
ncbi:fimbrial protein [Serratia fonticola]|uniref:fimbrial protein n=1 Tax=Serratia fonticola TaxID=47917 RepID=UPI00192B428C|nr:fimbrial protein [Serratia fonticola]MBL5902943.1 type 1 fimbrial protein [Serratia fonticola]